MAQTKLGNAPSVSGTDDSGGVSAEVEKSQGQDTLPCGNAHVADARGRIGTGGTKQLVPEPPGLRQMPGSDSGGPCPAQPSPQQVRQASLGTPGAWKGGSGERRGYKVQREGLEGDEGALTKFRSDASADGALGTLGAARG